MIKFPLLEADQIEVRVKKVTEKGAIALLYKTARTDMDMLDEVVGAENWSCEYKEIKGNLYCGLAIKTESGWVTKWDCGIESREDDEGNQKKGEASDAFKRAGFKWGIGRELYTAPFIFIPAAEFDVKSNNGRFSTFDTFSVHSILYENGNISFLRIVNNKRKSACYTYGTGNSGLFCECCKKEIRDTTKMKADEIAKYTLEKYHKQLCSACARKQNGTD